MRDTSPFGPTRHPVFQWSIDHTLRAARTVALFGVSMSSAWASDWYVDATNGDDANAGTSPSHAWRTITHALATAPDAPIGGTQTIHLAPGTYYPISPEVFPIELRDAFELVGDGGPDVTVLRSNGEGTVIAAWSSHFGGANTGPLTAVKGLTVQDAGRAFEVLSSVGTEYLTIEDCRVHGASDYGILVVATCGFGCGATDVTLDSIEVANCKVGIYVASGNAQAPAKLTVVDSDVVGNSSHGVIEGDAGGGAELGLLRTRIHGNGGDGLWLIQDNQLTSNVTHATVTDCLIASNAGDGVRAKLAKDNITNSSIEFDVVRSTIADNHCGVEAFVPTAWSPDIVVALKDSIVYGNVDDLDENPVHTAFTSVNFCDIGDGDFAGSNGNFSADPLFVDPPRGDYRLRWDSPCVETGDAATPRGMLDLAGNARPIDGDLDAQKRFDVGAYEFAPLFLRSTGELGTPLTLELWGAQGNATTVYFTRKAFGVAHATPFGGFHLDPLAMHVFHAQAVGSGPPRLITRPIPNGPAFVGHTFAFQALTTSPAAPLGSAYTNPVEITFVP